MRATTSLVCVAALSGLLAVGCVSNKKFDGTVTDMSGRIDGVQSTVEDQGEQIGQLKSKSEELSSGISTVRSEVGSVRETSNRAMQTATEAKSAAKGKVLWQVTLTEKDVTFPVDGTMVTASGKSALDQLVSRLKSYDKMVFVEIQGHTDATGSDAYNQQLGHKRAEMVRNYLHSQGIPLNLMSIISFGEARPIADNSTREGRAANRRVEVLVLE